MSTIYGNPLLIGGGGSANGLNVFCSTTQPNKQNGLWIKRAKDEVENVLIKPGFYLPDGETTVLGQELNTTIYQQACAAIDGKIYNVAGYTRPGGSNFAAETVQIFDTETETVTSKTLNHPVSTAGHEVSSRNSIVIDKAIYYWTNNSTSSMLQFVYDTETNTETYKNIYPYKYTGIVKAGNFLYICAYNTSNSSFILKLDIETQTTTIVWQESGQLLNSNYGSGFSTLVGQVLWFISGAIIKAKFDLSTNVMTVVSPTEYINNRNSSNAPTGLCRFLDTVYSIGGGSTSEVNNNIYAYNLLTGEVSVIEGALNYTTNNSYWGGAAVVNGIAYVFGGGYHSGSYGYGVKKIAKFRISTSKFGNKTIVVSPSLSSNVTEMYSDKLTTLDFGVDEVYYQSASGFSKQPAAIIKNGVSTDIN